MGRYIADASTRFVFGCTTLARHVQAASLLCDFARKKSLRDRFRVALHCFLFLLLISDALGSASSLNISLTLFRFAGNKYSISNESRTKSARIFFAQGCEMVPEMVSQSAAE